MSTLIRTDCTLLTAMGDAVSGGSVWVCTQPANVNSLPPSPLASIYSDNAGADPITQPLQTNGQGQTFFYTSPGVYTLVYWSPVTGQLVYVDQTVVNSATPAVNEVVPSGAINGSNVTFTLPSVPTNYLQLFLNGVLQLPTTNYTITGNTITMNTAPQTGDQLFCVYQ
jgi:hypothetical protein